MLLNMLARNESNEGERVFCIRPHVGLAARHPETKEWQPTFGVGGKASRSGLTRVPDFILKGTQYVFNIPVAHNAWAWSFLNKTMREYWLYMEVRNMTPDTKIKAIESKEIYQYMKFRELGMTDLPTKGVKHTLLMDTSLLICRILYDTDLYQHKFSNHFYFHPSELNTILTAYKVDTATNQYNMDTGEFRWDTKECVIGGNNKRGFIVKKVDGKPVYRLD